jgi:hypothetical protein
MCNCNDYQFGQCPCAKNAFRELREEAEGFTLIMEIVSKARSGRGYRSELKRLSAIAEVNSEVKTLVNRLANNLGKV